MVKKYIIACVGLLTMNIYANPEVIEYIENLYANRSGYGIPSEESSEIINMGGAPTYGEITYESLEKLIDKLGITETDVIYDLGSGVGKVITQCYLTTPVKKAVGSELSPTRVKNAQEVKKQLETDKKIKRGHTIEFRTEDIANTDLSDASIVYMCSTCFSHDLLKKITENAAKSKKRNLRIVTLKQLPENKDFKLSDEMRLKMTWSSNVPVYIYERVEQAEKMKNNKKSQKSTKK